MTPQVDKVALIDQYRAEGMGVAAACKKAGYSSPSYYKAKNKHKKPGGNPAKRRKKVAKLVTLQVEPSTSKHNARLLAIAIELLHIAKGEA
jgi:hypothetical protein